MDEFESAAQEAVDTVTVAGAAVVGIYKTKNGDYNRYEHAFGKESILPSAPDMSTTASVLWVWSCTKLLTAISALQLVERGLITLDEPLSDVLPEFKPPIPVLGPLKPDGTFDMTTTDKPITLRHLLTHTSGLGYEWVGEGDNALDAWRATLPASDARATNNALHPRQQDITRQWHTPLLYEPGAEGHWSYGPGLDWAGRVVERVNGEGLSLGGYMAKYIWGPLGMRTTTFRPLSTPGIGSQRVIPRTDRLPSAEEGESGPGGRLVVGSTAELDHVHPVDEAGGVGMYSTADDYSRVLESLLRDDGQLLSPGMAAELFRPQLATAAEQHPRIQWRMRRGQEAESMVMHTGLKGAEDIRWNHSLGGLIAMDPIPGKFEPGVMQWTGAINLFWWIDRKKGTAGFYGSQLLPASDGPTMALYSQFQKGMAKLAGE